MLCSTTKEMEQTTEQKRRAILEAIKGKRVSGNELEPSRKGATVSKLKAGKPVTDESIDRLYARLIELLGKSAQGAESPAVELPREPAESTLPPVAAGQDLNLHIPFRDMQFCLPFPLWPPVRIPT